MNYTETLNFIHSIPKFRRPLGNEKLSRLLDALGAPQKKLKFIHIAGTNGKGSTAAMTAEILKRSGYKNGLFTSPFLEVFNDRIRVNGENISDFDLTVYAERVKTAMTENDAQVSEFAFVTAVAFLYFYEKHCDFVVLEVGMGGKLDATNVIDGSLVSVICKIGLDHTQYLGDSIEEIAREKCGIIRENGSVVSYPNTEVKSIIKQSAKEKGAELIFAEVPEIAENGFIYKGKEYTLSLKGAFQLQNAAVVLEIINVLGKKGVKIPENAVKSGLANTKWAARFEFVAENVIIDGGHNIDGIRALKESLLSLNKDIVLVTAMMEDKDYNSCIREIAPIAKRVVATELDMPRCLKAEKLAAIVADMNVPVTVNANPESALKEALTICGGGMVCVCGSLFLAGEVRKIFR
ncbi:MAG: bifunctional folylpolyglutamate synthase/dihydrofolate synthase [Oscillospiraceae bacterium]|nr:bifunctional folylpolyglutamate synthase/dihydrofolate synthase [Oscillospiraceae bacterium]